MSVVYFIKPIGMQGTHSPRGGSLPRLNAALSALEDFNLLAGAAEHRERAAHRLGAIEAPLPEPAAFTYRQVRFALQRRNALLQGIKTVRSLLQALPQFPPVQHLQKIVEADHG